MKHRGILIPLGLALLAATAGYLLTGCNSSTASAANTDDAKTASQLSEYFKSTDWVAQHPWRPVVFVG